MKPLDGIRVLDMSRLLPGPMCSWYLVGLGASVTKIESPDGGDYLRTTPPLLPNGQGAWFSALHAGKKSVCLNLKLEAHQDAMMALLAQADVLIESSRPGVLKRLGLDPDTLQERFPRLIVVSITGFGQTGPMSHRPGHDLGFQALAGTLSLATRSKGVPAVPGVALGDVAGGSLTAALRICAALVQRERTGLGGWLDVSMTEGAMALMAPIVAGVSASGSRPRPGGEILTGGSPRYRVYRCADGRFLAVAALEPKFWSALCEVVGREVETDPAELERVFMTKSRDDWAERLGQACCEPVLEIDELGEHPQHQHRRSVTSRVGQVRVSHPMPGGEETAWLPSPSLGEDTEAELAQAGYDPERLQEVQ